MKTRLWIFALALGAAAFTPALQAQLPDLRVSGLSSTAGTVLKCAASTVNYTFTETNAGNAAAGRHYIDLMRAFSGSGYNMICRTLVGGLNAGQSLVRSLTCVFYNGPCDCPPTTYTESFYVLTDSTNVQIESDESNNASNVIVIPGTCP